jgi:hypothetical protein
MDDNAAPRAAGGSIYHELRGRVFTLVPETVGIEPLPSGLWGIVVDTAWDEAASTLVALADGSTSLYFSTGGGIIGGGDHEPVRAANAKLLASAIEVIDGWPSALDDDLPATDHVYLWALTEDGPRRVSATESDLASGRNASSRVYLAAHDVITALRAIAAD